MNYDQKLFNFMLCWKFLFFFLIFTSIHDFLNHVMNHSNHFMTFYLQFMTLWINFWFFFKSKHLRRKFLCVFFDIFNLKLVWNILNKVKYRNHLLSPQNFQIFLDTILICLYIILIRWQTFNLYDLVLLYIADSSEFSIQFSICISSFKMPSNAKCKLILI